MRKWLLRKLMNKQERNLFYLGMGLIAETMFEVSNDPALQNDQERFIAEEAKDDYVVAEWWSWYLSKKRGA